MIDNRDPRQGARSDAAAAVHRRWREGPLSKAIRNTFGVAAAIQRCQVHKGRNIIERLPQHLHASVKKALRQAYRTRTTQTRPSGSCATWPGVWSMTEPGVSGSILEGLDEILTVIRRPAARTRRSLACTNIVENASARCARSPQRQHAGDTAEMALRWTAAVLLEAAGKPSVASRPIASCPSSEMLSRALRKAQADSAIETIMKAA